MLPATQKLTSIGRISDQSKLPVRYIEQVTEKLGIAPRLEIDSIPYFDNEQVESLSIELAKRKRVEDLLVKLEAEQQQFLHVEPYERLRETGRRLASGGYERLGETTKPGIVAHRAKLTAALQECRRLLKHVADATPEALEAIRSSVPPYNETWTVISQSVESVEASV